ncbi:unnamed protein product (macronuclear) [Paramecium tetraurelia]|uniref:Uncharacterized protein n=2 Tax=Paramecium TaxID=5884 RepID=A0CZZ7_PARTE|nr:uncharacterized protein GSPATT00011938001 [Paramecium tetraurelia]CAD8155598.1 unnamed protein product [Paramecium octaurelia]CAK76364.1 unnamed protein product [Paramecium tetraurelia]|eukprot:XP_001443761.1 hypothetical protein (macronuclear) [Paramecium tetraurelia strain d4-2]
MGSCYSKKPKTENCDIRLNEKPREEIEKKTENQLILEQYHRLSQLIELIGNTDSLNHKTRERINYLIIIRSNISIIIQHEIKKQFKLRNITKQVNLDDEKTLYHDKEFSQRVLQQIKKLISLLDSLQDDQEFENSYPILSFSLIEINESIKSIIHQFLETKTRNTSI